MTEFEDYISKCNRLASDMPISSLYINIKLVSRHDLWAEGIEGLVNLKSSDLIGRVKEQAAKGDDEFMIYGIPETDLYLISNWSIKPVYPNPGRVRSVIRNDFFEIDLISFWIDLPSQ